MQDKKLFSLHLFGAFFVIILGTLMHFAYQWSGNNVFMGLISPVNESVWEHLKLAFFPIIFYGIYEAVFLKNWHDVLFAKATEVYLAMSFIISGFYIYTAFTGQSILAVDISLFCFAIIMGKWGSYIVLSKGEAQDQPAFVAIFFLLVAMVGFFVFTFNAPQIPLFLDTEKGIYGIIK